MAKRNPELRKPNMDVGNFGVFIINFYGSIMLMNARKEFKVKSTYALFCGLFLILTMSAVTKAHADAEGQMWGRKAGDYFSAVVMASEFKKTICGQYLNVPNTWTDTSYARQNILNKLPTKYHQEFNAAFTQGYESQIRQSVRADITPANKSKCKELATGVKDLITPRINGW